MLAALARHALIRSRSSTVIDRDRAFRYPLVRYDKPNPRRLQHLVVNCDYTCTKCGNIQPRDRGVYNIPFFITRLELYSDFLCFKPRRKDPTSHPKKQWKRYLLLGCENPTQIRIRPRILVQNGSGLTTPWCTDMEDDVLAYSSVLDARTGRLAGFEIPPREYQIAALVRLNRPPTYAVSRLPCLVVDTSTSSTTRSGSWILTWILLTSLEIGRPSELAGLSTLRFQIRFPDPTYAILVSGAYPIARTGALR